MSQDADTQTADNSNECLTDRFRKERDEWNAKAYLAMGGKGGVKSPRALHLDVACKVAEKHGLTIHDILSESRVKKLVVARHEAWLAVAKQFPWLSSPQLGRLFKRDHSSILYALHKHGFRDHGLGSIHWRRDKRISAENSRKGGEVQPETTQETSNETI